MSRKGLVADMELIIMKKLMELNEKVANDNREYFRSKNILAVNVMGAPGSGKTTLISAIAKKLPGIRFGVIEGDIASSIDAERLESEGMTSVQINTCGECHLDARCIRDGAEKLHLENAVVFIENVGNLICPAEFDLGEELRLLTASVTEGDDKPFKYVPMFSYADIVVLTKTDVAQAVGFEREHFIKGLRALSQAKVFDTSGKKDVGIQEIADYLKTLYENGRK